MATLAEVARRAGVSPSTVSYVLSGKRSISEETRLRVQTAIEELDYHPNAGARALASSKSHIIALVVPLRTDLYVPVMMQIAIAVTTTARKYGHDVLLITNDEGPAGVRRVAATGLADAVILMDVELHDERVDVLRELDAHAALIGLPADPAGLSCVDLDFAAAGRLAAGHLAGLGHREIAFIGSAEGVYRRHTGFAERTLTGFTEAARDLGLRTVHRPCEGTYEGAAGALARILDDRPGTTGFVVQNEAVLTPLLSLLRTSGRTVPEDASVLAVGPDQLALMTTPRLAAIAVPAEEMGRRAVEMVLGPDAGRPGVELLDPVLTVRESTGPVPAL
jgi:DNA-binding LacI/PurR family transcriptional regulator